MNLKSTGGGHLWRNCTQLCARLGDFIYYFCGFFTLCQFRRLVCNFFRMVWLKPTRVSTRFKHHRAPILSHVVFKGSSRLRRPRCRGLLIFTCLSVSLRPLLFRFVVCTGVFPARTDAGVHQHARASKRSTSLSSETAGHLSSCNLHQRPRRTACAQEPKNGWTWMHATQPAGDRVLRSVRDCVHMWASCGAHERLLPTRMQRRMGFTTRLQLAGFVRASSPAAPDCERCVAVC